MNTRPAHSRLALKWVEIHWSETKRCDRLRVCAENVASPTFSGVTMGKKSAIHR